MMTIDKLRTPQFIFFIYVLVSSLFIMIFRFILPGSDAPLLIYSFEWRLTKGALELINLFPALSFSALIIPFGIAANYEETFQSFSEMFFKRLVVFVITAIIAAIIYGMLFFLALPALRNHEENMRYAGELYKMAKMHAQDRRNNGEWQEAAQFLAICDRIWYGNEDLNDLRIEIEQNVNRLRLSELDERSAARRALARDNSRDTRSTDTTTLSGGIQPATASEAFAMSRTAFDQRRYFDAHWLAVIGGRLAVEGSPDAVTAGRLAGDAWNMIASLAPNQWEDELRKIYNLKMSGYQAMNNDEWIRAFYIFSELTEITPDDPDVKNFLARSEQSAKQTAFFIDEMELALGEILTGAVFSLPNNEGRVVLRFTSLTTTDDSAYGMGFEFMSFDVNSRMLASARSRFAKVAPVIINEKSQIMILMHALDREDENASYDSEWIFGARATGGLLLNISFEDFLLLSEVRRGLTHMQIGELFTASGKLNNAGYVQQIFQAEIINRLGTVLFFLPMAVFTIIIGWRYRAKMKPRYLFIVMLGVLPVVFHGFVFLYRSIINILGIALVLSMGFSGALALIIGILTASLFASLVVLAAQRT